MELPSPFAGKGNLRRQMSFIQLFFSEQVRRNVQLSSRRHCAAATSSIVELVGSRRYGGGGGGSGWTADNTARRLIVKSMLVHRPFFLPLCQKET